MVRVRAGRRVLMAALTVAMMAGGSWMAPTAFADDTAIAPPGASGAPDVTAQTLYGGMGSHPVATNAQVGPCQASIVGFVQNMAVHIFGNTEDLTCTAAFPNGLDSPIGVNTYFPADIADLTSAPLIVLTGGIDSNPGMYDRLARQWASNGFVVTIPYDWFNSLAYVPAAGLALAIWQNRDAGSPLFGKVDLSRTIFAGHSAGGQSTQQIVSVLPGVAGLIDPDLHVAGALAIEPGPLALGPLLGVPTLYLTGMNDFVVPDFAWVRWWQYNLTWNAPAWIANARGVSHFSPVDDTEDYRSSGTAVAWLRYLGFEDETAKQFFVGPNWALRQDKTYFSVERNALANAVR
ncbi:poly(ethylene terephthalate) hydrolase family protein [Nocardia concava]|uniref:poly(ethylene terephthalate) hydrolase family protein n=1 Tax=Nocardia concava TaxID=257281 RepID=UPI0002D7CA79|nr:adenylate cyclase [Nocardia concava]